jgi:hypothetical protein
MAKVSWHIPKPVSCWVDNQFLVWMGYQTRSWWKLKKLDTLMQVSLCLKSDITWKKKTLLVRINFKKFKLFLVFISFIIPWYSHFCVKGQNFVNPSCEMHLLKIHVSLKYKINCHQHKIKQNGKPVKNTLMAM